MSFGSSPPQTEYERMALSIVERAKSLPPSHKQRYTSSGMKRIADKIAAAKQTIDNDMLGVF